jgi:hypothetical protein
MREDPMRRLIIVVWSLFAVIAIGAEIYFVWRLVHMLQQPDPYWEPELGRVGGMIYLFVVVSLGLRYEYQQRKGSQVTGKQP